MEGRLVVVSPDMVVLEERADVVALRDVVDIAVVDDTAEVVDSVVVDGIVVVDDTAVAEDIVDEKSCSTVVDT